MEAIPEKMLDAGCQNTYMVRTRERKSMKQKLLQTMIAVLLGAGASAQVNSGSNGSDGAFNPTTNTVINMADHPNGVYQYTSVNIPTNVTVTFIPNANNSPVTWLVQSNCVINGTVNVSGQNANGTIGGAGGPGGWAGGSGGSNPSSGQGVGGGNPSEAGSFASQGYNLEVSWSGGYYAGQIYGNSFLLPLLGGSGGGGDSGWGGYIYGGGGGGGAILMAASSSIQLNGYILSLGGNGGGVNDGGDLINSGGGSGGGIRLVTTTFTGNGNINAPGGGGNFNYTPNNGQIGGSGRIRIDALQDTFGGTLSGSISQGFQPIIIPTAGQGAQLTITSVGGVPVSASPSGQLVTPDAVLSAQQNNPISIVVHCSNIPLNTQITVSVRPANGATVSATGYNSTGTLASSTATILITMPRGGGIIFATAAN